MELGAEFISADKSKISRPSVVPGMHVLLEVDPLLIPFREELERR